MPAGRRIGGKPTGRKIDPKIDLKWDGNWQAVGVRRHHLPSRYVLAGKAWREFLEACQKPLVKEAEKQANRYIYDTPPGRWYVRTWNLFRANATRITKGRLILYNDVPYAEYVHEGTRNKGPRPWLRDALDSFMGPRMNRIARRVANKTGTNGGTVALSGGSNTMGGGSMGGSTGGGAGAAGGGVTP